MFKNHKKKAIKSSNTCKFGFLFKKIYVLLHIKIKKGNLKISVDAEKSLTKPNMTKTLSKLGIEGNFLKLIKDNYENHLANIIPNGKQTLLP